MAENSHLHAAQSSLWHAAKTKEINKHIEKQVADETGGDTFLTQAAEGAEPTEKQ